MTMAGSAAVAAAAAAAAYLPTMAAPLLLLPLLDRAFLHSAVAPPPHTERRGSCTATVLLYLISHRLGLAQRSSPLGLTCASLALLYCALIPELPDHLDSNLTCTAFCSGSCLSLSQYSILAKTFVAGWRRGSWDIQRRQDFIDQLHQL
ncbi:hypothetical protein GGR56DRAFT_456230 [Xylariaceae sp. FL0804]|nr:hypothetical protein GGR56DRAFT_456230 [Xylariaceae sp. FL0804]